MNAWEIDPFFETPSDLSIDGGTTSAGSLWHAISPRWGHSMHSMCSYQGMFPARVAHYFVQRYSRPGDTVLDPFSGRGTTLLQARVEGRRAIGNDLSPLAYVLSAAKAAPPSWEAIMSHIDALERRYRRHAHRELDVSDDIRMLYHDNTLRQLVFLRSMHLEQPLTRWTPEQYLVMGSLAGIMHGSWRRDGSSQYLSISMPNTFSMSPTYVRKYIEENGLQTIDQDVFERLRDKVARLYTDAIEGDSGTATYSDAVALLENHTTPGSIDLVLTSPPYLQVVNYAAANWIRLWLLGVEEVSREGGAGRRRLDASLDHRHAYASYRDFILRTLRGIRSALAPNGVAVVVIGDVADPGQRPVPLAAKVWEDIGSQTMLQLRELIEDDLPAQTKVSRIWGETRGQATNRDCALVLTHPDAEPFDEPAVSWGEPYRDAGPDAAHDRVRAARLGSAESAQTR